MNVTKKHVAIFLASTIALTSLPYAGYWYGQKTGVDTTVELIELICSRGGLFQFPDGRAAMCLPVPKGELKEKLDNSNQV